MLCPNWLENWEIKTSGYRANAEYVNYYDREMKLDDENKTIGIVLCQEKNQSLVEYTLPEDNEQIFASTYKTVLPSKEEFIKILEEE